jgi:hypothetical protein
VSKGPRKDSNFFPEREARRQLDEEALIRRADGEKPLKQRLKEFAKGSNNFERMGRTETARRKKVKKLKNQEATIANARRKTKEL